MKRVKMGILKWMKKEEEMIVKNAILANQIAEEQKRIMTCKKCQKIFSEGYPYERAMFGKVKNYVCKDCAKQLGII